MALNTFCIRITETLEREVKVKASTLEEAMEKAELSYDDEIIVLDSSDYVDTNFDISNIDDLEQNNAFSEFLVTSAKDKLHRLSNEDLSRLVFGSLIDAKTAFLESQH